MTPERTVLCPRCEAPRTTKANKGTRLNCTQCGEPFLAPAPPAPADPPAGDALDQDGDDSPSANPTGDAHSAGGDVVTLKKPKVRQTARPRERGKGDDDQDAGEVVAIDKEHEFEGTHPLATPDDHPSKQAGRRGGRGGAAIYDAMVGR